MSEYILVTDIRGRDVWGVEIDPDAYETGADYSGHVAMYWPDVDASEVRVWGAYEIESGEIIAELEA